jgi:hypothetical protein
MIINTAIEMFKLVSLQAELDEPPKIEELNKSIEAVTLQTKSKSLEENQLFEETQQLQSVIDSHNKMVLIKDHH